MIVEDFASTDGVQHFCQQKLHFFVSLRWYLTMQIVYLSDFDLSVCISSQSLLYCQTQRKTQQTDKGCKSNLMKPWGGVTLLCFKPVKSDRLGSGWRSHYCHCKKEKSGADWHTVRERRGIRLEKREREWCWYSESVYNRTKTGFVLRASALRLASSDQLKHMCLFVFVCACRHYLSRLTGEAPKMLTWVWHSLFQLLEKTNHICRVSVPLSVQRCLSVRKTNNITRRI